MNVGDRVVLVCAPWPGTIEKVRRDGLVDVALDGGGKAKGMGEDDVKREEREDEDQQERERARATADKSWPPKSMETKVPRQQGQK